MSRVEKMGNNSGINPEVTGEQARQVAEERGEKTIEAEKKKRIEELLDERETIAKRLEANKKELARRRAARAAAGGEESTPADTSGNADPTAGSEPTPTADIAPDTDPDTAPDTAPKDSEPTAEDDAPEDTPKTDDEVQGIDDETVDKAVDEVIKKAGEGQPNPEDVKDAINKAKKDNKFKKFFGRAGVAAAIAIVGLLSILGSFKITEYIQRKLAQRNAKQTEETVNPGQTEDSEEDEEAISEDKESPFDYESVSGIIDGYGEKGMFLSPNKGGQYDFAAAQEVAKVCKNDRNEMLKYVSRLQVGNLASYIAGMPEELQPEGFKGLSILEAEEKIESLSPDKYDALFKDYGLKIKDALTREVVLDGEYENVYMRIIDPSKPVTHENIELVTCVTEEHGTKAIEYYWLDDEGNEIGSIITKMEYDENGNIIGGCTQLLKKKGISVIFKRLKRIDGEPTKPEEIIKQKNGKKLVKIDKKMNKETAKNIKTKEVKDYVNPGVKKEDKTTEPAIKQETAVQNDDSKPAEKVTTELPANDYGTNQGGANSDEYQPVEDETPTLILSKDSTPQDIYDAIGDMMDEFDRIGAERAQQKQQQLEQQQQ
ncbi:hypothetical protein IKE98_01575 [Candidatus Saccharibacteria bacterium]|nr:hypothetical protein [Candidatus Saccharibacteria bacterium]